MILPGKHLPEDRALLRIGVDILNELDGAMSVSELWERFQRCRAASAHPVSFDWFVLALTFLYTIEAVGYEQGLIVKEAAH